MRGEKDDTEFSALGKCWIMVWFYWDRKSGRKTRFWGKDNKSCVRHHMFLCLGQLEKKTWSSGEEHGLRTEDSNISTWMVFKDKKVGEIIQGEMTEEKQAQDRAPWHSKSQGKRRGRQPIKDSEKHVVSVERIWFGNRQLWPHVPGKSYVTALNLGIFLFVCMCTKSLQSCSTVCGPYGL